MNALLVTSELNVDLHGQAPNRVMYMPKGKSKILATVGGKAKEVEVDVGSDTAGRLQAQLQDLLKHNVRPFIDFDHKVGAAAALPKAFTWDPDAGGVFLELDWTGAGKRAVSDKDYSYFSPTFLLGPDGKPAGLPRAGAIGALTNSPAFRDIQRIAASTGEPDPQLHHAPMQKLNTLLVGRAIVAAADADDDDKVTAALSTRLDALGAERDAAIAKATQAEKDRDAALAKVEAALEETANADVQAAVTQGRIAPQDEAAKGFWKASLKANPTTARQVLAALPANPAFKPVVTVANGAAGATPVEGATKVQAQRVKLAQVKADHPGMQPDDVFLQASLENPELFQEAKPD